MFFLIIKIALYAALMYGMQYVVPGVTVDTFWPTAVIAGVVFAIINAVVKPILNILTLPITIITLGLFTIVINAVLFWWVGQIVNGFDVSGWLASLLGGLVASIGAGIINTTTNQN